MTDSNLPEVHILGSEEEANDLPEPEAGRMNIVMSLANVDRHEAIILVPELHSGVIGITLDRQQQHQVNIEMQEYGFEDLTMLASVMEEIAGAIRAGVIANGSDPKTGK